MGRPWGPSTRLRRIKTDTPQGFYSAAMSAHRALVRRWVWTVWSAALAWAVVPTLLALAGLAPSPSIAMTLGEVCSVAGNATVGDDAPVPQTHGASCLLCVISVPVAGVPTVPATAPRPLAGSLPEPMGATEGWMPQPPPRRACPQGPPTHA